MLDVHGFSLGTHQYTSYQRMSRHRHPEAYLCVVATGGFIDNAMDTSDTADAGAVLIRPAGDQHYTECGAEGAICLKIEPRAGWLSDSDRQAIFHARRSLHSARLADQGQRVVRLAGLVSDLANADLRLRFELESSILDLIATLLRPQATRQADYSGWLEKLRLAIVNEPFRQWTAAELGQLVDRHPVHVSRAFRERYGETIGSFFRRQRLERARDLISHRDIELADIALTAGFADQAHFTREYKREFGITPGRERQSLKMDASEVA